MSESASPSSGAGPWPVERVNRARHHLRNPLGVILGFCGVLEEELAEAGHAVLAQEVKVLGDTAAELTELVDRHLNFSQLQAGRSDLGLLEQSVLQRADEMLAVADRLGQGGGAVAEASFASDVALIREAAGRLRENVSSWLSSPNGAVEPLPAVTAESDTLSPHYAEAGMDTVFFTPAQPLDTGRVLVVDDNESNRLLLARRLARQGYTITPAADGREALALLRAQPFDLVLLDILMPEMDGHAVLAELKADESLRHLPVIMISALDDLGSLVRCIRQGAEDYLTKPFDPVLLRARVGACLEKKRLRDREVANLRALEEEKRRADELLHVLLPHHIAEELKATQRVQPRRHDDVAVLFCDIVDFTGFCDRQPPEAVLECLQWHMTALEQLAEEHGLEKIKTSGDAFMATAGLLVPGDNPALQAVRCGLVMRGVSRHLPAAWEVRVGIHVGPVIAGVVGRRTYLFDVWGDTVNTAARLSNLAAPGSVCVSPQVWQRLPPGCAGESSGVVPVKGKGPMELFSVRSVPG